MYAKYNEDGCYTWTGNAGVHCDLAAPGVYVGIVKPLQYHDLATNEPVDMPPRPSNSHFFNFKTKSWELNNDHAWTTIRQKRDALISATDWQVTRAAEASQAISPELKSYRQALRDITKQSDPLNIVWPALANPTTPT